MFKLYKMFESKSKSHYLLLPQQIGITNLVALVAPIQYLTFLEVQWAHLGIGIIPQKGNQESQRAMLSSPGSKEQYIATRLMIVVNRLEFQAVAGLWSCFLASQWLGSFPVLRGSISQVMASSPAKVSQVFLCLTCY